MKTERSRIILMLLLMLVAFLLSFACTPQKRLNRLVKKHPELVHKDTVFIEKTITLPSFIADTSAAINKDLSNVDSIISHYKNLIDSATAPVIVQELKNYIINRKVLNDTLRIDLGGGYIKLFQSGDSLRVKVFEPEKKIIIKTPVAVNSVEPIPQYTPWERIKIVWSFVWRLLFLIPLVLLIWERRKHKE